VLGFASNERLLALTLSARVQAQIDYLASGEASRVFTEFPYQTRDSWSRARRVVVLRRRLAKDLAIEQPDESGQLRLSFTEVEKDVRLYEYAVLALLPQLDPQSTEFPSR
jgi:hypothetical protein